MFLGVLTLGLHVPLRSLLSPFSRSARLDYSAAPFRGYSLVPIRARERRQLDRGHFRERLLHRARRLLGHPIGGPAPGGMCRRPRWQRAGRLCRKGREDLLLPGDRPSPRHLLRVARPSRYLAEPHPLHVEDFATTRAPYHTPRSGIGSGSARDRVLRALTSGTREPLPQPMQLRQGRQIRLSGQGLFRLDHVIEIGHVDRHAEGLSPMRVSC